MIDKKLNALIKHYKEVSYYQPKDIIILKDMPITSSQKIDYRELEEIANPNL